MMAVSTEAKIFWYKMLLGMALESKSSDLDLFKTPGAFPNLKIWTPGAFPTKPAKWK